MNKYILGYSFCGEHNSGAKKKWERWNAKHTNKTKNTYKKNHQLYTVWWYLHFLRSFYKSLQKCTEQA